jgi:hypothetical protein
MGPLQRRDHQHHERGDQKDHADEDERKECLGHIFSTSGGPKSSRKRRRARTHDLDTHSRNANLTIALRVHTGGTLV